MYTTLLTITTILTITLSEADETFSLLDPHDIHHEGKN